MWGAFSEYEYSMVANAKLKGLGTVFDCQRCARPRAREGVY